MGWAAVKCAAARQETATTSQEIAVALLATSERTATTVRLGPTLETVL